MKKIASIVSAMLLVASLVLQAGCGQDVAVDPTADEKAAGEEQHQEGTPEQKKAAEKHEFKDSDVKTPK